MLLETFGCGSKLSSPDNMPLYYVSKDSSEMREKSNQGAKGVCRSWVSRDRSSKVTDQNSQMSVSQLDKQKKKQQGSLLGKPKECVASHCEG